MLEQMLEWDAQAARDSENLAMLVDRDDYWLNSEYSQWVTNPDDPEVKAERARRLKEGIKPPPTPLLRPVAHRPTELAAKLWEKYGAEVEKQKPAEKAPTGKQKMSAREAARLLWSS
jgi:hypothetical protein